MKKILLLALLASTSMVVEAKNPRWQHLSSEDRFDLEAAKKNVHQKKEKVKELKEDLEKIKKSSEDRKATKEERKEAHDKLKMARKDLKEARKIFQDMKANLLGKKDDAPDREDHDNKDNDDL